ncbi:Efflux pump vrtL [Hypsizygus marmoreus]|uniref:Efflux pump vrtL n=1 Tax=Hypsizygus marmoreus TaxID=39966 RepID=A0A369J857_HYPMA|nr:Efflux pump vrtL [Hypsizygus marmoreus]
MSDDFSKEKRVPSRSSTLVSATFADTTEIRAPSESNDAIIVDWDGPDDPANPKNWPYRQKWAATLVVSSFTFISPVSSSMVAPATAQVAVDFGVTDTVIIAMMTSIFVLAYAIGPLFLGPMSEIYGRSRVIQLSNVFYLVWNLACGFAQTKGQFIAFRFLAGLGGSAPLSIGGGVLGDVWHAEERGKAIAIYSLAPLLGPVVGPVCGAWIAEKSTWRWVFWSTSIVDAAIQVSGFFFLQETFAPLLLEQKAKLMRKSMDAEKGQAKDVRTVYEEKGERSWSQIFSKALTRPFLIFGRESIAQLLGIYMAFIYGVFYLFLTNIPGIFEGVYHEQTGIAGLNYISIGLGLTLASQINARYMDRIYKYYKAKNNGVGEPEFRLPSMVPATFILPAGLLIAGWSAEKKLHWILTDFGIFLVGGGMIPLFQAIQTYVVDAFTLHAASALAAVSCLRSLAGFGFPLFAPAMFKALGYGKGNTILAAVSIALGCPAPWLFWKYGKRIRTASKYAQTE